MDPIQIGLTGLGLLFVLILLHVPIGVAMGVSGLIGTGLIIGWDAALTLVSTEPTSAIANEGLGVVALFLLMGNLAFVGGLSGELYRLFQAFLGHRRGGLSLATIGSCAGFGAVCGSAVATTATMTRVALPEMLARGYSRSLASGTIAAGGTLGIIIPPSVVLILYGVLTENSILVLFVASVVPGLLAVALYVVAVMVKVRLEPSAAPTSPPTAWAHRLLTLRSSWAVVSLALVVGFGIYSGVFTVTEGASLGATFALLLAWVRRRLDLPAFLTAMRDTAKGTGLVFVMIIGASIFGYFVSLSGMPAQVVASIESLGWPPLAVLALLMVLYLIGGALFDEIALMILTLPFVYPLIESMGYDPIWWGIINVVVIELGMIIPPLGINVFVLQGIAKDIPLTTIYRGVAPFIAADLVRLAVLILFPPLALWLPTQLGWMT
jgi:tripartite ATP-independent transporter DctM subunit